YNWKRQCRALACQRLQDQTPAAGNRAAYAAARKDMLKQPKATLDTTLQADIGAGDLAITLSSAAGYRNSGTIQIDKEIINYTSRSNNVLTVPSPGGRGSNGTPASAHLSGATVNLPEFALPPTVKTWLADLALFHRVPFHYLVPDEGM